MYSSLIGETSSSKKTCSARPSAPGTATSAVFTPLAHAGYDSKSAITAMTRPGGASITIEDVVCSAMVNP